MKYFILILFQFSILSLYSQDTNDHGVLINDRTKVYKTFSHLSASEVLEKLNNGEIKPVKSKASQGLSNAYYWLSFQINKKDKIEDYLLELNSPHIDTAALYCIKN